ncbi:MAG TPA: hypothetical protein VH349_08005 [Ktedonobacterales bacterium]
MRHPIDRQILDRDHVKLIDNATTVLMREIAASPRNPFVNTSDNTATFGALWRAFLLFTEVTLDLGKRFFLLAEETWVGNLITRREGGKRLQAHVNAHLLSGLWQGRRFRALTGKADEPLARAAECDRRRLGRAFDWTVQEYLDLADAMQPQASGLCLQLAADWDLGIGEAVVAALAPKTGIPWRLACPHTAKEGLKGEVNAYRDVLQHLRLNLGKGGSLHFERRQGRLLIVEAQRFLPPLPCIPARSEQVIEQPATFLQLLREEALLLLIRVQTVLERLTHAPVMCLKQAKCQAREAIHPPLESRGLSGPFP